MSPVISFSAQIKGTHKILVLHYRFVPVGSQVCVLAHVLNSSLHQSVDLVFIVHV